MIEIIYLTTVLYTGMPLAPMQRIMLDVDPIGHKLLCLENSGNDTDRVRFMDDDRGRRYEVGKSIKPCPNWPKSGF